jgi:glycosyltransferase involved in cell wall biosynthesis
MRVGLDIAPLLQTRAGTARWVSGLRRGLEGRADVDVVPLAWGGDSRLVAVMRDVVWYPALLPRAAARAHVDVLHCTIFRAPPRARVPTILTVHDLAVLRHPEVFPAWTRLYGRTALRPTIRAVDRVFAVSEFSKRETVELTGVDPDRIDVVPNALEPAFGPDGPALDGDYVLAVGTLEPRKNLKRIIEATRQVGVELRLVGAPGWGDAGVEGSHVTWLGRIDDDELAAAYRGARALVFPSLYEGFGIPVLEAMASGTPVVTSEGGATAEVAGDAAVLVDPLDVAAIAAAIEEADGRRAELGPRGLERAKLYTWDRAVAAAVAGYERALG